MKEVNYMNTTIIIGGGIVGASTAYHLAKAGEQVILFDRKDEGQATDAAAGIICPWLSQRRNKAWYTMAREGAKYYPQLIEQLEKDGETNTGYKKVGALCLHTDEDKLQKMMERAELRKEQSPEIGDVIQLTKAQTKERFPMLDEQYASVFVSGAARVNGRALRNALIKGAKKYGATIIQQSAQLWVENNEVKGVRADNRPYAAQNVIVTAGAWANELFTPLDLQIQVKGQRAQIVHLTVENMDTGEWPVIMPPTNQYILTFDNGKIVMGATYEDDMEFDCRVTAGGIHEILEKALSIAPGLKTGTFTEARVGFRPVVPDFLPVIGHLPSYENLLFANGLGATGLTAGPFVGEQLAKLVLDQELTLDLSLYPVEKIVKELPGN